MSCGFFLPSLSESTATDFQVPGMNCIGPDSAVIDRVVVERAAVGVGDLGAAVTAVERDAVDAGLGNTVCVERVAAGASVVGLDAADRGDEVPRELARLVGLAQQGLGSGGRRRALTTGCRWWTASTRCRRGRPSGRCRRASAGRSRDPRTRSRARPGCPTPSVVAGCRRKVCAGHRGTPCSDQNCHRNQGAGLLPTRELASSHKYVPSMLPRQVRHSVNRCYCQPRRAAKQ